MSKRQVDLIKLNPSFLLLGVLIANLWSCVVQGSVDSRLLLTGSQDVTDDRSDVGRRYAQYPTQELSGADEAALNWVRQYADGVAGYLYQNGLAVAQYADIARGFSALYNASLNDQPFMNEDTKMYIQGAVQGFLDQLRLNDVEPFKTRSKVAHKVDVAEWTKKYANKVARYLNSQNESNVDFATIVQACKHLNIPILHVQDEQDQKDVVEHVNDILSILYIENEADSFPRSDDQYLSSLVSYFRSKRMTNVNKADVINAMQDMSLPRDFAFRVRNLSPRVMKTFLTELNGELSVQHDPVATQRAVSVFAQLKKQENVDIASVVDVMKAVSADSKASQRRRRPNSDQMSHPKLGRLMNVIQETNS